MLTPKNVHTGEAANVLGKRQVVMELAYARHPERFVKGCPEVGRLEKEVWINRPSPNKSLGAA